MSRPVARHPFAARRPEAFARSSLARATLPLALVFASAAAWVTAGCGRSELDPALAAPDGGGGGDGPRAEGRDASDGRDADGDADRRDAGGDRGDGGTCVVRCAPGTPCAPFAFFGRQSLESGAPSASPLDVALADLDDDGRLDLLVVDGRVSSDGRGRLELRRGSGDGTFQDGWGSPATGGSPRAIALGDLNGDRWIDLAVVNNDLEELAVLLGNGDGTFQDPRSVSLAEPALAVTAGDLDGDGRLDLVVAPIDSARLIVLLGDGRGDFQEAPRPHLDDLPIALRLDDVNGDGAPDVVMLGSSGASVLLGNGDGTFQPVRSIIATGAPRALAMGDLDHDGQVDVVVATGALDVDNLSVLLGDGAGNFRAAPAVSALGRFSAVTLADADGDGQLDLLATATTDDTDLSGMAEALLGNGDGTFRAARRFAVGRDPRALTAGDLDGDGRWDLTTAGYDDGVSPGEVSVLLGDAAGTFRAAELFRADRGAAAVLEADFNHDGHTDLAVVNRDAGTISVLQGKGDGTFVPERRFTAQGTPVAGAAGDLDGDGLLDLVVANHGTNAVDIFIGTGDEAFRKTATFVASVGPIAVAIGDLDHDGAPDLLVANQDAGDVSVLLGRGDGTFALPLSVPFSGTVVTAAFSDLDGDGELDLIVGHVVVAGVIIRNDLSVRLGRGDGTFGDPMVYDLAQSAFAAVHAWSIAVDDLDGDGQRDVVVAGSLSRVLLLRGASGGRLRDPEEIAGATGDLAVTADLNGDGVPDLITQQGPHTVDLRAGNGDGTFGAPQPLELCELTALTAGDLDGDGSIDLAATCGSEVAILRNRAPQLCP